MKIQIIATYLSHLSVTVDVWRGLQRSSDQFVWRRMMEKLGARRGVLPRGLLLLLLANQRGVLGHVTRCRVLIGLLLLGERHDALVLETPGRPAPAPQQLLQLGPVPELVGGDLLGGGGLVEGGGLD